MNTTIEARTAAPGTPFTPDTFCRTAKGHPMPARIVERSEDGFATVETPTGKQYTFPVSDLLPVDAARKQMNRERVAAVLASYRFEVLLEKPVRVVLCSHPTRRASQYALTLSPAGWLCTCKAWAKAHACKHCDAMEERDRQEAAKELAAVQPAEVTMAPPAGLEKAPVARAKAQAVRAEDW